VPAAYSSGEKLILFLALNVPAACFRAPLLFYQILNFKAVFFSSLFFPCKTVLVVGINAHLDVSDNDFNSRFFNFVTAQLIFASDLLHNIKMKGFTSVRFGCAEKTPPLVYIIFLYSNCMIYVEVVVETIFVIFCLLSSPSNSFRAVNFDYPRRIRQYSLRFK